MKASTPKNSDRQRNADPIEGSRCDYGTARSAPVIGRRYLIFSSDIYTENVPVANTLETTAFTTSSAMASITPIDGT